MDGNLNFCLYWCSGSAVTRIGAHSSSQQLSPFTQYRRNSLASVTSEDRKMLGTCSTIFLSSSSCISRTRLNNNNRTLWTMDYGHCHVESVCLCVRVCKTCLPWMQPLLGLSCNQNTINEVQVLRLDENTPLGIEFQQSSVNTWPIFFYHCYQVYLYFESFYYWNVRTSQ